MSEASTPDAHGQTGYVRSTRPSQKNFFGALFDFSFSSFVTPMIVKVVYVLITIAIALALLGWIVVAFASDQVALGVTLLVLGWIPALLYLAFFRMTLEFYYSVVRMSQDINRRLPGS
jgi:Domain of unknown function (DUF4282)